MKEYNIKIAEENQKIINDKYYIADRRKVILNTVLDKMISDTKIYAPRYDGRKEETIYIPIYSMRPALDPRISITKEDSFTAAINQIIEYKSSCVLNFASAKRPGGGYLTGASAQEESLCRRSTLYASLEKLMDLYNWSVKHTRGGLYSDWCVLSPNVTIFRDEELNLTWPPYACSVLTSPAPNHDYAVKQGMPEEKIEAALCNRCELILKVAAANKKRNLVLGAFGCGVFGNDPEVCARIWKDLLSKEKYGKHFDHVTFAIKGKNETNYLAFRKIFKMTA